LDAWSKFGCPRFSPMSAPCLRRVRDLDSAAPMPARLRPSAPIAADAILVGDPGRALMLAQELLVQPKMSNHARGLWGYTGVTQAGEGLTIQSTGMGGPSAAVVRADLAELGVKRAIRIGTCTSLGERELGQLLVVTEANVNFSRSLSVPGNEKEQTNARAVPDRGLTEEIGRALPAAYGGGVVSLDSLPDPERGRPSVRAEVADMQTAALLDTAAERGVAAAAVLIVTEKSGSGQLADEELAEAAKTAGRAASVVLLP
jgi:uridine phosphorylase